MSNACQEIFAMMTENLDTWIYWVFAVVVALLILGWIYVAILFHHYRRSERRFDELYKTASDKMKEAAQHTASLGEMVEEAVTAFIQFGNTAIEIMEILDMEEVPLESQAMLDTCWKKTPPFIQKKMGKRVRKFFDDRIPPFKSPPPEEKKGEDYFG